jgi:hypothetical protein
VSHFPQFIGNSSQPQRHLLLLEGDLITQLLTTLFQQPPCLVRSLRDHLPRLPCRSVRDTVPGLFC